MTAEVQKRLVSLDIFRGVTIGAMIVVNNLRTWSDTPRFPQLSHAEWNGCTMADLIFPFFIFIVGVTTLYSLDKRIKPGESPAQLYKHILIRAAAIFCLGLVSCSWFIVGWLCQSICPPTVVQKSIWAIFFSPPDDTDVFFFSLANLRIPGVLQRIALVYLAVVVLLVHTRWRAQAAIAGALLLLYWGLMNLPGFALEPGQDLGAAIDRAVFGQDHLGRYEQSWDPEGLLSTLPAIATGLIGALTAQWLRSGRGGRRKLAGLLLAGGLGIGLGALWGLAFPINKYLWTSSFAVFTAGFALVFLGGWYWLIDLYQAKAVWAQPFVWLGMNPLIAYCASQIVFIAMNTLYIGTPTQHTHLLPGTLNALFGEHWDIIGQTGWHDPHWAALAWALLCLIFWTLVTGLLYRRRLFLKI
jgi:predicted acyltransferase